ncbi:MAG TPA: FRG domain-containing protein [Thermoanaerobaculia bacterium]|nr:FRG domain-containing protein [Thermoanaerobaculia bacterium]
MPVRDIPCDTAEEFLDSLSPRGKTLPPVALPNQFLFRGHSKSSFELLPSAHRIGARIPVPDGLLEPKTTWTIHQQLAAERDSLLHFFALADQAGLYLPGDIPKLREDLEHVAKSPFWPVSSLFSVMALAQHHGLPTRLLDWTRDGAIAAYFAAKDAARSVKSGSPLLDGPRTLSVWAFRPRDKYLENPLPTSDRGISAFALKIVTAPRSSNPNLHAQKGIFTLLHLAFFNLEALFRRDPLDKLPFDPPLEFWHFTLPMERAPRLLRLLALDGICASTLFPGYGGVVEALQEQSCLWD